MPMVVEFVVHGDLDDAGYRCCVVIAAPVTLVKLREHFAFENVCLFRQKVCGSTIGYPDIDHLWLDLDDSDMNAELPNCTEVQALIVNGPESEETYSYDEYLADLANTIPDERLLNSFQKESAPITLKSIGKVLNDITEGVKSNAVLNKNIKNLKNGVTQVWKNVGEFASKLQQQPPRPVDAYVTSPVASELSLLSIKAATNFRDSNPEHLNLLRKVFEALFPGQSQSFKRKSVTWKDAGYQNQDPVADLKKTGLISLCGIVYLGDTIPERLQMMVQSNKTNIKTNYPFAVVAVNLSMLLIELFHLRENRYMNVETNFWDLFLSANAFFEIFTIAFIYMDNLWRSRDAVRSDFGKIMNEVKGGLQRILQKASSMEDFKLIAQDEGIAIVT